MKITKSLAVALKKVLSLQLGQIKTDKAVLSFDGEELAVGTEVFVIDENGDAQPAEDGEYIAEDGKTIVVAEGKVAEIKEAEAEPEAEPEAEEPEVVEAEETPVEEPLAQPIDEPEEEEVPEVDRVAALEQKMTELLSGIQNILNVMSALEGRVVELENKVAKVEAEPAEEPIDETTPVEEQHTKAYYLRRQK